MENITHKGGASSSVNTPWLQLWFVFFFVTAIIAYTIQLILLPGPLSVWHAGDGLLISSYDSIYFHKHAVALADKIGEYGWAVWELKPPPSYQVPAGIAGAIYALTVMKPWVLIPLNAVLHASTATALLKIVLTFQTRWKIAIWAVLPFLLYPSAASWYAQIHRDGFSIAGCIFFLLGWILLVQLSAQERYWHFLFGGSVLVLSGFSLAWFVRPYLAHLLLGMSGFFAILATILFVGHLLCRRGNWQRNFGAIFLYWVIFFVLFSYSQFVGQNPMTDRSGYLQVPAKYASKMTVVGSEGQPGLPLKDAWKGFTLIDKVVARLANLRSGFVHTAGASSIDSDIRFASAMDILYYLPRALQVSFCAPFPNQWFGQGSAGANTMMRRVSMLEMLGVYAALVFVPYALWYWRQRIEAWFVLFFCGGMLVIHGVVVNNIGTLYRLRYGYLMVVVAFGISGMFTALEQWRKKR